MFDCFLLVVCRDHRIIVNCGLNMYLRSIYNFKLSGQDEG